MLLCLDLPLSLKQRLVQQIVLFRQSVREYVLKSLLPNIQVPKNGRLSIKIVPMRLTMAIDVLFSLVSAPITGSTAAIADEPQTAFPEAIRAETLAEKPSFLPINKTKIIVEIICIRINPTPENPNLPMV